MLSWLISISDLIMVDSVGVSVYLTKHKNFSFLKNGFLPGKHLIVIRIKVKGLSRLPSSYMTDGFVCHAVPNIYAPT